MRHLSLLVLAIGLVATAALPAAADTWPTYAEIGTTLSAREASYPNLCKRYDLGTTPGGRHLWALKITNNVNVEADKPEFRYISTLHGDEITGVKMCMNLMDYLLTNYSSIPRCTNIVDNIELWILPLANPDGYDRSPRTRYNNNGADLNRSFPEGSGSSPELDNPSGREPEVAAIMNWTYAHKFICSANFHGGTLVVNYPYDNDPPIPDGSYAICADDDLFIYISEQYSQYNPPMWGSTSFTHGITNGSDWYAIDGGLQDYSYRYHGDNAVTIELGTKEPDTSQIPTLWTQNRDSMLAYVETCLIGIRGTVTDGITGAPLAATVTISGRNHNFYTDPDVGDYHCMLKPGTYTLNVSAAGYNPVTLSGVAVTSGAATRRDVQMYGPTYVTYPNGGEQLPAGAPVTVTWTGDPAAQYHVQYSANYGATSASSDGFERTSLGPDYTTGGNLPWLTSASTPHSGSKCARSGSITHNQTSWMTRTISGADFSFWYRVSSEADRDFFNFYVDGSLKLQASGTSVTAYTQYSQALTAGNHTLKWEYTKDSGVSSGTDVARIDDLQWNADATTWTDIVALTPVGTMSTSWTPTSPGTTYKVRVRPYKSGAYGPFDESNGTFSVVASDGSCCHADGTCTVTSQAGCSETWTAGGTCSPNNCPQPTGSCCHADLTCTVVQQAECSETWTMFGDCDPNPCPCPHTGDMNEDGRIDGMDIQLFIAAMLGTPTQAQICHGDFNGSLGLDAGDVPGLTHALLGL
jgi:hypothetical protein